jgi:hypothetical protein
VLQGVLLSRCEASLQQVNVVCHRVFLAP